MNNERLHIHSHGMTILQTRGFLEKNMRAVAASTELVIKYSKILVSRKPTLAVTVTTL